MFYDTTSELDITDKVLHWISAFLMIAGCGCLMRHGRQVFMREFQQTKAERIQRIKENSRRWVGADSSRAGNSSAGAASDPDGEYAGDERASKREKQALEDFERALRQTIAKERSPPARSTAVEELSEPRKMPQAKAVV